MDRARTVKKLVYNAFRYRLLKFTGRSARLEAISLEITHRCLCRCHMCNIWKIPKSVADLPLSDWVDLLSSPTLSHLRELDITGGEPFLRDDLGELLGWICRSKPVYFPHLKTIALTTNGILSDRVLELTAEMAGLLRERGIDLVLACGMDAVGELHDHIRNFKGAWRKLETTLLGLKALREHHSNLIIGVKTTIVPSNVNELEKIASFARKHNFFTIISPRIITANRFGNQALKEDLKFSDADIKAMIRFYEGQNFAWSEHRRTLLHYFNTGSVKKPCSAGFNTVFVRHNGEVFPCPLISDPLGKVHEVPLSQMLASPQATQFRKRLGKFPECKVCTEPGLERIAWPFEGFTCLRRLSYLGFNDFDQLTYHMGIDKYLQ